jgi:hypothetical protein
MKRKIRNMGKCISSVSLSPSASKTKLVLEPALAVIFRPGKADKAAYATFSYLTYFVG